MRPHGMNQDEHRPIQSAEAASLRTRRTSPYSWRGAGLRSTSSNSLPKSPLRPVSLRRLPRVRSLGNGEPVALATSARSPCANARRGPHGTRCGRVAEGRCPGRCPPPAPKDPNVPGRTIQVPPASDTAQVTRDEKANRGLVTNPSSSWIRSHPRPTDSRRLTINRRSRTVRPYSQSGTPGALSYMH